MSTGYKSPFEVLEGEGGVEEQLAAVQAEMWRLQGLRAIEDDQLGHRERASIIPELHRAMHRARILGMVLSKHST